MNPSLPKCLLLIAIGAMLLTGCTTYRGWMRPDPHSRNDYLVPVPKHASVVVVSAPPGWHLDPEGGPVYMGSFIDPKHFLSPITVDTSEDREVSHGLTQARLHSRVAAEDRRREPGRLAFDRKFRAGFPAWLKVPPAVSKDPVTYRVLKSVSLRDGRPVQISRSYSPTQGYSLSAFIPEDGFYVKVEQTLEDSRVPEELLEATAATVESYRLRAATPRELAHIQKEH